jgi:hypothetical protein
MMEDIYKLIIFFALFAGLLLNLAFLIKLTH